MCSDSLKQGLPYAHLCSLAPKLQCMEARREIELDTNSEVG